MESVSLRSYSDAYPCHRVPTSYISAVSVNRLLRPSPSDRCMDYHLLSWKTRITASERGAPSGQKNGLFQMTDISPCVGTLWHG